MREPEVDLEIAVGIDLDHHQPKGHRHCTKLQMAEGFGQLQLDPEHAEGVCDLLVENLEVEPRERASVGAAQCD